MAFDREPFEPLSIDMTPLVDCIFAIILFLLVVSSIESAMEQDISIDLPTMGQAIKVKAPPTRPIIVNVRNMPNGAAYYHVEGEAMNLAKLRNSLSRARVVKKDQSVVIRGDRHVRWEHVANVMTACAQAGITKVSATVEVRETQ